MRIKSWKSTLRCIGMYNLSLKTLKDLLKNLSESDNFFHLLSFIKSHHQSNPNEERTPVALS